MFEQGVPVTVMPRGATAQIASSGSVANVQCTASISSFFDAPYLTGFEITGVGATAASVILVTVTGIVGGTLTYVLAIPAGVTTQVGLIVEFPVPLQGGSNTITVTVPAFGAGSTNQCVVAHGFHV